MIKLPNLKKIHMIILFEEKNRLSLEIIILFLFLMNFFGLFLFLSAFTNSTYYNSNNITNRVFSSIFSFFSDVLTTYLGTILLLTNLLTVSVLTINISDPLTNGEFANLSVFELSREEWLLGKFFFYFFLHQSLYIIAVIIPYYYTISASYSLSITRFLLLFGIGLGRGLLILSASLILIFLMKKNISSLLFNNLILLFIYFLGENISKPFIYFLAPELMFKQSITIFSILFGIILPILIGIIVLMGLIYIFKQMDIPSGR